MWIWLLCLSWFTVFWGSVGDAAVSTGPKAASEQPVSTTVVSQKMTFKNQESQAVFDGAVVLTR